MHGSEVPGEIPTGKVSSMSVVSDYLTQRRLEKIASVEDARDLARRRVPTSVYQMFEAGSGSNITARRNEQVFEEVLFRPRNAVSLPSYDISTTVLGHKISMPAIVSSVGFLSVAHSDGEAGVARAAGDAGTIQFVSGVTTTPIETIMANASGPVFYQLYYVGGRDASAPIIDRVKAAGVKGLVLTVDTPTIARPKDVLWSDRRSVPMDMSVKELLKFAPQVITKPGWALDIAGSNGVQLPDIAMALRADGSTMGFWEGIGKIYEQTPAWEDLPWIRRHWDGPIVLKGILTVEDAERAVREGADAIVVSNHGGNVLDGAIPTLQALPRIVDAVGDKTEVLVDSGVRRGTDVLKAVSMGAKAALLGRGYVYPLMAAGEPGVRHILDLFKRQIEEGLAFLGTGSIHDLDRSFLDIPASWERWGDTATV